MSANVDEFKVIATLYRQSYSLGHRLGELAAKSDDVFDQTEVTLLRKTTDDLFGALTSAFALRAFGKGFKRGYFSVWRTMNQLSSTSRSTVEYKEA